jgi:aspartate aminotransferase
VYPVPSWNNNHYAHLTGSRSIAVRTSAAHGFYPTAAELREHLPKARLLVINSPNNPTGTVIRREALLEMTQLLVEQNRRRVQEGRKALFMLYDQVYWTLTFGGARHYTPVELVPESAPYVIFLDAVSKTFAATGLRVGWCVAAPAVTARMRDFLGHVGAWAPKAEQMATAEFLDTPGAVQAFSETFRAEVKERLGLLHDGFMAMKAEGLPVESIAPQGAIYLSVRFDLIGRRFSTNEEIRRFLLEDAGFAAVPFQAFGLKDESGWFRLSVGAVSRDEIAWVMPRLRAALATAR